MKACCKKCGGRGYIVYSVPVETLKDEYGEPIYGSHIVGLTNDYMKKCPECSGIRKDSEDLTGVPSIYRDVDMTRIRWQFYRGDISDVKTKIEGFEHNFESFASVGKGLYIHSKTPGSGKTFLACCIGKSVMVMHQLRFKFITAPEYIEKCSEAIAIKKSGGFHDPRLIYKECELLVIDDIGAQIGKEWQQQELFDLINRRQANSLVTIFTSNYDIDDLNLEDRTKSRIYKSSIKVQLPEQNIRKTVADAENARFMERLLDGKE